MSPKNDSKNADSRGVYGVLSPIVEESDDFFFGPIYRHVINRVFHTGRYYLYKKMMSKKYINKKNNNKEKWQIILGRFGGFLDFWYKKTDKTYNKADKTDKIIQKNV